MGHKSKQKVTNQPHQKQQTSTPNKIKILTRDQFDPSNKTQNLNSPCMLCNSSNHPTHRCLQTRQLRDKKGPVTPNFVKLTVERFMPYVIRKYVPSLKQRLANY